MYNKTINTPLKHICTLIITCLKHQIKNHSKISNYDNIPKPKTSKSDFSKPWSKKGENTLDIMIQPSLLLQYNTMINIVVLQKKTKVLFLTVI